MKVVFLLAFSLSVFAGFCQINQDSVPIRTAPHSSQTKTHTSHTITTIAYATGYVGATYLCYRFFDDDIQHFAQSNQSNVATSFAKTYEYAGLGTSSIIITVGTAVTSVIIKDKKLQKTAILLAAGYGLNDFVTNQFKITFQRHRPNTGDSYNSFDWRGGPKVNTSFISAHTSNAFVAATAFATVYHDKKWIPIVAYSAASLVGLCRVYNNAHWASDVLGGAAVGFASVKAINGLYNVAEKKVTFFPEVRKGHCSATLVCKL